MGRFFASAVLAAGMIAAGATTTGALSAEPGREAHYAIQVMGWVPLICRATLSQDQVADDEGIVDLGDLQEFCNDAGGYQVWIDSAPGVTGMLYVDGQEVPLSADGATLVSSSTTAAKRTKHLVLDIGANESAENISPSLSIRVVAL